LPYGNFFSPRRLMPPISIAHARRLYEGPPRRSIRDVAAELGCSKDALRHLFSGARIDVRPHRCKSMQLPETSDQVLARVMALILCSDLTWPRLDAEAEVAFGTVRDWFTRPERRRDGPPFAQVARVAEALGYRLALVPAEPEDAA
jgi:AcrR family transcriptional regulator